MFNLIKNKNILKDSNITHKKIKYIAIYAKKLKMEPLNYINEESESIYLTYTIKFLSKSNI